MASSIFSFLVLWTLWARIIKSVIWKRKKKICTIGIGSCKVMVNQPAFVGADQQDVVGSSHGGDQAMALACIPFQSIDGEHASLAIPCKRNPNRLNCLAPASSSSTRRPSSSSSQECYNWSKECVSRHTYLSLCAAKRKTLQSNSKQHSIDMMMISKRQSQSTNFSPLLLLLQLLLLLRSCCYYSSLKAPIQTCCWRRRRRLVIITRQEEAPRRILLSNLLLVPWKNHQK